MILTQVWKVLSSPRRAAALALALLATGAGTLTAQGAATVSGVVKDAAGQPVAGARVGLVGAASASTTSATGAYRLTLPAGRHELRISAIGFGAQRAEVTLKAGEARTLEVTLQKVAVQLDEVVTTGTRSPERTVTQSPVPVDIVTAAEIRASGRTETAQILQMLVPSINFPRPTVADGSDHTRPATLRGLAPDQVLVLINGKRRHQSALINVNGTVGRGSGMVDLNAIPASAIDHIEVLRDGAAAQYGSDAIAGVINIVLKQNAVNDATVQVGQTATSYTVNPALTSIPSSQTGSDGRTVTAAANYAVQGLKDSYLQFSGEFRSRGFTNRSAPDPRQQYFTGDPNNTVAGLFNRTSFRQGDANTTDVAAFVNAGTNLSPGVQLYLFGGGAWRSGTSAANFRIPRNSGNVVSIYPNGFLPLINSTIADYSGTLGVRGESSGWRWDLSTQWGQNSFQFGVDSSVNASLGAASPTRFDAGTLAGNQWTTNLDIAREFPLQSIGKDAKVNLAFGGEFRRDGYSIAAGDQASYIQGTVTQRANQNGNVNASTAVAPAGAQGFPGFRPTDVVDVSRTNVAGYVDVEFQPLAQVLIGAAARYENYSDFGSKATFKGTARVEPVQGLALRGAVSTGFRAPSLGQSYFSATATNLINGTLLDVRTFPVSSPQAVALGATPLQPETSTNFSAGIVVNPARNFQFTADFYQIDIDNRVVLSGNFTQTAVTNYLAAQGFAGVAGGRFFTNAINTTTRAMDLVANWGITLSPTATLRLTGAANIGLQTGKQLNPAGTSLADSISVRTATLVRSVAPTPPQLAALVGTTDVTLFDRVERGRMEYGQPQDNFMLMGVLDLPKFAVTLRNQRYGQITIFQNVSPLTNCPANQTPACIDQTYAAKIITDLSATWKVTKQYQVTLGVDNLLDVYPDAALYNGPVATNALTGFGGNSNFGIFPFPGQSPFGFNGRYVWVRAGLTF